MPSAPPFTQPLNPRADRETRSTILYLNHSGQMAGAESSLLTLLRGLRRDDAPYDAVVGVPDGGPFSSVLREEGFSVTMAPLRRVQRPRGIIDGAAALVHVLQTAPHICRLVETTGAKIIHSNSTTAHLVGGLAGERTGRPTIWHCRDLVKLSRLAPQLASKATRVIAISGCVAELLESEGVPKEKIERVPNGINPERWQPRDHSALRESLHLPEGTFLFGMVGQLVPWKNHAAFIEAAAKLLQDGNFGQARFAIIGGDLWGEHLPYIAELRELVKQHNIEDRVNFIPHQADGVDAIAGLDALVHPTLEEPFGRVILEALAMQKPVIAMNSNGPREIITHEHDGLLVPPDKPDGLLAAMLEVLTNRELREHLSHHGRITVETRFHSDEHAKRVAEIYRGLGV